MGNNGCCGGGCSGEAEKSAEKNSCSTEKTGSCGTEKTGSCGDNKGSCGSGEKGRCLYTVLLGGLLGGIVIFAYFLIAWMLFPWHKAEMFSLAHRTGAIFQFYIFSFAAAALLTKVLKKSRASGCCPVFLSIVLGLLAGGFHYLPSAIWFNATLSSALQGLADDVVAIALAGITISTFVLRTGGCKAGGKTGSCGEKTGGCGDTKPTGSCGDKGSDDRGGCCH